MLHLKDKVRHCLEKDEKSRNSDIRLTNCIWIEFYQDKLVKLPDGSLAVRLRDLYDMPREDDVKRVRALFNHKGLYLPTDEKILKQRKIKEREWHNEISVENKRPIKLSF